jgi:hypothetical protein
MQRHFRQKPRPLQKPLAGAGHSVGSCERSIVQRIEQYAVVPPPPPPCPPMKQASLAQSLSFSHASPKAALPDEPEGGLPASTGAPASGSACAGGVGGAPASGALPGVVGVVPGPEPGDVGIVPDGLGFEPGPIGADAGVWPAAGGFVPRPADGV